MAALVRWSGLLLASAAILSLGVLTQMPWPEPARVPTPREAAYWDMHAVMGGLAAAAKESGDPAAYWDEHAGGLIDSWKARHAEAFAGDPEPRGMMIESYRDNPFRSREP